MHNSLYGETATQTAGGIRAKDEEPMYGKGEELFNAISHTVGAALGIIFAVIAFLMVSKNPSTLSYVAVGIYSFSVITLYTMSALYHFLPHGTAKRIFRVFDHCTIFLLIAGTYTPYCLIVFWAQPIGKIMFAIEWGLAVVGITLNAVNMRKMAVKVFSMISYVIMGWLVAVAIPQLLTLVPLASFVFLLAGGIAYTVGIIFYALGKHRKYMHCVWHVFVIVGSVLQFVSILYFL